MQIAAPANAAPESPSRNVWRWFAALMAVSAVLLFFQLGARALNEPDETRYAEIPREMLETGDYLSPRVNGLLFFDKPPLMYWATAASFRVFGVNEFAARLPLVLCALAGVAATFWLGVRWGGARAGFLSGWILASSVEYFFLSRTLTLDMMLGTFTTLALVSFWKWHRAPQPSLRTLLALYFWIALGVLTKGPVAVILVGAPVLFFVATERQWSVLRRMNLPLGCVIVAGIASPWFVAMAQRHDEFLKFFFGDQNFSRFLTSSHQRGQPLWFFIPVLVAGLLPWTLLLVPAVRHTLRQDRKNKTEGGRTSIFLFYWAAVPFVFFSLSGSKLITYILPMFAPLALLIANFLNARLEENPPRRSVGVWTTLWISSALGAAGVFMACRFVFKGTDPSVQFFILALAACPLLVLAGMWFTRFNRSFLLGACVAVNLVVLCGVISQMPHLEKSLGANSPTKSLAAIIARERQPDDVIATYGENVYGLSFYLQQHTLEVDRDKTLLLSAEDKSLEGKSYLPDNAAFCALLESPRRVLCVSSVKDLAILQTLTQQPLFNLGRSGKYILFSNRPSPSASP